MAFNFLQFFPLPVLGDVTLGKSFLPKQHTLSETCCLISPRHGRVLTIKDSDMNWISLKGIGWTFGGPQVYRSTKDECMMFGLCDLTDAEREQKVSDFLQTINPKAPKIIGIKNFSDVVLNKPEQNIVNILHTNGKRVDPCVLYTQTKSPFRMADIAFFTDKEKEEILNFYTLNFFKCAKEDFMTVFAEKLAEQIGLYHSKGVINDSLYWDNITLCAEIIDYEWLTIPNMLLPNGQDASNILTQERKEKEIIYAIEALLRMAGLFHLKTDFYSLLDALIKGYCRYNEDFYKKSVTLQRIMKRENIIY